MSMIRSRWAAVGAAVAITLGAGGVSLTQAAISSGEKPVFVSLDAPCRVVDTRPGTNNIGAKNTPITAGETNAYEIQITGNSGNCTAELAVPADAVAVALNVTAISPVATTTGRSFFTVYPANASLPNTSNLNFLNGQAPVPNKVDVGLSPTGKIKIFNAEGTAHAAVDIFGYYIDHNHDDIYYRKGDVDTALGTKANAADVTAALNSKANSADVTAALDTKANTADVTAALATKANAADVTAALATKANATDVYTKADIDAALFRRQVFGGYVDTDGTKEDPGSFTSSNTGTGLYSVTFDFTGDTLPAGAFPMVIVASPSQVGPCSSDGTATADWSSFDESSINLVVATTNGGVPTNCGFSFIASFAGSNDTVLPLPSSAGAVEFSARAEGDVTCVNKNGEAICE